MTPTASVVMTVRDGARYIGEALDSILEQRVPVEVVVVDDGSSDDTRAIATSYGAPVTVVCQPPLGIAAGLNRGLTESVANLVAFLDADDVWEPLSLERRLEILSAHSHADGVRGRVTHFRSPDLDPSVHRRLPAGAVHVSMLGAMLLRRELFDRVGCFDESIAGAPAIDWVARSRRAAVVIVDIDDVVLRRRIHARNTSTITNGSEATGLFEVLRRQVHARTEQAPPG